LWQVTKAATVTRFDMLGSAMLSEMTESNALLRRYVYGPGEDEPVVWYEGTGTADRRFLHADERGSIIAISNASGAVSAVNTYDEYGIPASTNMGRFGYTGQAWLPEIGLNYYKARIYSPTLGRFMQSDPIGYGDGLNFYDYVGGDPVNARDPTGLLGDNIVVTAPSNAATFFDVSPIGPYDQYGLFAADAKLRKDEDDRLFGDAHDSCIGLGGTFSGDYSGTTCVLPSVAQQTTTKRSSYGPIHAGQCQRASEAVSLGFSLMFPQGAVGAFDKAVGPVAPLVFRVTAPLAVLGAALVAGGGIALGINYVNGVRCP
jgi:RHS repeat-associated protein